jgi:hypothetical protein
MPFNVKDNKNVLLNVININGSDNFVISEKVPAFSNEYNDIKLLTYDNDIQWTSISGSDKIVVSHNSNGDITIDASLADPFKDTPLHFSDDRLGVGRLPLHNYKVDISVPINTRMTGFHIGDGVYGLSMGNATGEGFLPQIIGMGSDSDDAGLYLLGKISVDEESEVPAIILDGRAINNEALTNRPIFAITSGSYTDYKLLVDQYGNVGIGSRPGIYKMKVDGVLKVQNIIYDTSTEIVDLRKEIEDLKNRISLLEQK